MEPINELIGVWEMLLLYLISIFQTHITDILSISCEIVCKWMPQDFTDGCELQLLVWLLLWQNNECKTMTIMDIFIIPISSINVMIKHSRETFQKCFQALEDILCGISKGIFEVAHKMSYPYIENRWFYTQIKF